MTIKEMETRSGMTRANIRFYEAEGLLSPSRERNGYRNYSETDLETLLRVKLLRTLRLSLEEIKALYRGEEELTAALDAQLGRLAQEQEELERSKSVCRAMREDGVRLETLDAQRYLDAFAAGPDRTEPAAPLQEDRLPKVQSPWRRFFARSFDLALYGACWNGILALGLNVNVTNQTSGWSLLNMLMSMLLMLLLEPVLLSLLGTTPGKWIVGLRVSDQEDRRLSYRAALVRTWRVLWKGMGFQVAIYDLVRLWKCYRACQDGETLDWEYESDSVLTLGDERGWRGAALAVAYVLLFGVQVLILRAAELPRHRGDLTVAEFCENYNRLADYLEIDADYTDQNNQRYQHRLDSQGDWQKAREEPGVVVVFVDGGVAPPEYRFTQRDGVMTGLEFTTVIEDGDVWAPSYQEEMILSIRSFVTAREENGLLKRETDPILRQIQEQPFESFQTTVCGVEITCTVEYSGYAVLEGFGMLIPEEEAQPKYQFQFSMERIDGI